MNVMQIREEVYSVRDDVAKDYHINVTAEVLVKKSHLVISYWALMLK